MEPFKQSSIKYTFYQYSQTLYGVMQKDIENHEFIQGVNFDIIDSLKNNSSKILLVFDAFFL